MKVAPGREIDINGRRYLSGDQLPPMSSDVSEQLLDRGDIERDVKDDEPRGRRPTEKK